MSGAAATRSPWVATTDQWLMITTGYYDHWWKKRIFPSYSSRVSSNSDRYPLFRSELYRSRNDITKDKRFENETSPISPKLGDQISARFVVMSKTIVPRIGRREQFSLTVNVSFNQSVQRCCSSFHCFHKNVIPIVFSFCENPHVIHILSQWCHLSHQIPDKKHS